MPYITMYRTKERLNLFVEIQQTLTPDHKENARQKERLKEL